MRCCSASLGLRRRRCWSSISPMACRPTTQSSRPRSIGRWPGVRSLPSVTGIILPRTDPSLISDDGDTAYAVVGLSEGPEEAQRLVPEFEAALVPQDEVRMSVAGAGAFYRDIETVSQRDLRRAEVIVFPIALVALLLVFGSVVAALMPLAVGAAGVTLVLVSIFFATRVTDLSIFVLNLATMLGLGLSVDYSLFVTSRYREELAQEWRQRAAGGGADDRHGGQSGLLLRRDGLDRLDGSGAVRVHVPALGRDRRRHRRGLVDRSRADAPAGVALRWWGPGSTASPSGGPATTPPRDGFWVRLSLAVMARPLAVLIPTLALLLLLGTPFLAGEYLVARRDDPAARSPVAAGVRHSGSGVRRRGDLPVPDRSPIRIARRPFHRGASRLDLRRWRAAGQ